MKDYDKKNKKDINDYLPYDDEDYFEVKQEKPAKKDYKYRKPFNKENPY